MKSREAPHSESQNPLPEGRAAEVALRDRVVRGEARAWRELDAAYRRLVVSTIAKVVARSGARACSDDVREIEASFYLELLVNDCAKLRAFDPTRGARLGTWIAMLASHAAHDFLRRRRRDPRPCDVDPENCVSLGADPAELCDLAERARLVSRVTSDLSAKDREFLDLYYGEGLTPPDVAARMGISVNTVYSKKHKIQGRLEGMLAA